MMSAMKSVPHPTCSDSVYEFARSIHARNAPSSDRDVPPKMSHKSISVRTSEPPWECQ